MDDAQWQCQCNHFNKQAPPPPILPFLPNVKCVTVNVGNWKMFLSNIFHDIEIFLHLIKSGLGLPNIQAAVSYKGPVVWIFVSALQRIFTGHSLNNKINKCESWCYVCSTRSLHDAISSPHLYDMLKVTLSLNLAEYLHLISYVQLYNLTLRLGCPGSNNLQKWLSIGTEERLQTNLHISRLEAPAPLAGLSLSFYFD